MKATKADGVEGVLLRDANGKVFFRVYDAIYNFVDYDLDHSDLKVVINDDDAFFWTYDNGDTTLDHSPKTLGRKVTDDK